MPKASSLNFGKHHMLFRDGEVFLNPGPSYIGFRALEMSGDDIWTYRTLSRPFMRINRRPDPTIEHSDPDCYTQGAAGVRLTTEYFAPGVLRFEFDCEEVTEVHIGPACDFKSFGGVLEQEFLVCWGHGDNQSDDRHGIRMVHTDRAAILATGSIRPEAAHSGYRLSIPPGKSVLGLACGGLDDADLETRAEAALGSSRGAQNADFWDALTKRLPPSSERERAKAVEAVWAVESSTTPATGSLVDKCLASCVTALWYNMYLWDTCFAVLGYRRVNPELCQAWLNNFIQLKTPGLHPLASCISKCGPGEETQVPLFSWAARALYDVKQDGDFLAAAFRAGKENNDWWMSQADETCGGLPKTKAISYDNSPIYDRARIEGAMMRTQETVNPDIVAALVVDCDELIAMAEALGDSAAVKELSERRHFLVAKGHEELYDAEREYYFSKLNGESIPVKVGPALNSIVFAPESVARGLAETYVRPGSPAWPVHGIATVLADEPSYEPNNYWRGMIWGSTNRLLIDALDRRGFSKQADLLSRETVDLFVNNSSFYEVISPETGIGQRGTHYNGFGTGVYLDLLERAAGV